MLFLPLVAWAQKQYCLPTATSSDEENDRPMIEVYLAPRGKRMCCRALSWWCYALAFVGE